MKTNTKSILVAVAVTLAVMALMLTAATFLSGCAVPVESNYKVVAINTYAVDPYYVELVPGDSIYAQGQLNLQRGVTAPDSLTIIPHGEDVSIVVRVNNDPVYMPKLYNTGDSIKIYFWAK